MRYYCRGNFERKKSDQLLLVINTLGVTFDIGHVLVPAWEELRGQAVSVNEGDYLGGLGRTVRLRDRLQGGEMWVIV